MTSMSSSSTARHSTNGPAHPTPATYLKVATLLAILTAAEVGIFYSHGSREMLLPIFMVLAAGKFTLVGLFYMHLKFDSRLFSGLFVGGLFLAVAMTVALMALFGNFL